MEIRGALVFVEQNLFWANYNEYLLALLSGQMLDNGGNSPEPKTELLVSVNSGVYAGSLSYISTTRGGNLRDACATLQVLDDATEHDHTPLLYMVRFVNNITTPGGAERINPLQQIAVLTNGGTADEEEAAIAALLAEPRPR